MFKFKNHYNEILASNFISYNNDPALNQGLIKKINHEESNWLEIDSTLTELKINFLYSYPLLDEKDRENSKAIIEKYTKLNQNIIWVMLCDEDQSVEKDQFKDLGLEYEVSYKAMLMNLKEVPSRDVKVPQGFTLKKLAFEDLEKFKGQIDEGFGKGVIDTTKYATLLKINESQKLCDPILIYHNDKVVGTGNIYYGPQAFVIDDITINKNYRGQGLASVILYNLLEKARQYNCEKLLLVATKDGLPIYKKMGFNETGLKIEIFETRN
ncbi:GNAT family N-acetyltransferase [Spiroplasma alleghenense]|uniref:N-acetyltransferase domain-containing protein n=1 Tax=Spiroplasma alleghenense TaxID=216931 RepID=A0A345Z4B6_9MOLU|nr:GNAT family N-acetyltransferase [Spiroplasma alleghenense]AXK51445.1 hypothetical protein SALLE_v1c07750 [Spiroplasma alleghenense]